MPGRRPAVVETSLHLPVAEVELALSATIQACAVGTAFAGKGSAKLQMPATKHARHQVADLSGQRSGVDVSDVCIRDG